MVADRVRFVDRLAIDQASGGFLWWGTIAPDTKPRWYPIGGTTVAGQPVTVGGLGAQPLAAGSTVALPDETIVATSQGLGVVQNGQVSVLTVTTPPTVPPITGLSVTPTATTVAAQWTAQTGATYDVMVNGVQTVTGQAGTTYVAGPFAEGTAVTISVRGRKSGVTGAWASASTTTTNAPPAAPTVTGVTSPALGQASVAWSLSPFPSDFARVEIFANGTYVGQGSSSPVTIGGLAGAYTFQARAVDTANAPSGLSNGVAFTVPNKVGLKDPVASTEAGINNGAPARVAPYALDGNSATFWLSGGRLNPNLNANWWQAAFVSPSVPTQVRFWPMVTSTTYVSVADLAGGAWVPGAFTVPEQGTPAVASKATGSGGWDVITLPGGLPQCIAIRLSQSNLGTYPGYSQYRSGMAEVEVS